MNTDELDLLRSCVDPLAKSLAALENLVRRGQRINVLAHVGTIVVAVVLLLSVYTLRDMQRGRTLAVARIEELLADAQADRARILAACEAPRLPCRPDPTILDIPRRGRR